MRTIALRAACLGLIIAGGGLIAASAKAGGGHHGQNQSCSMATLDGLYVFWADGFDANTNSKIAVAGYEIFDGHGHFHGVVTASVGGNPSPPASIAGYYTVKQDCTGTETITTTNRNFDIYVLPSGDKFTWVETDTGVTLSGDEVRDRDD